MVDLVMTLDELLRQLDDDSYAKRVIAAQALGTCADRRAVKPLLVHLVDDAVSVRREVAAALGALIAPAGIDAPLEAIDALWDTFTQDPAREVRTAAARSLVPTLTAAVLDPNGSGQKLAVDRLVEVAASGCVNVVESLPPSLRASHDFFARAPLDWLIELGDPAAVVQLLDTVRGYPDGRDWRDWWEPALRLGRYVDLHEGCRSALIECLDDESPRQRAALTFFGAYYTASATTWPLESLARVAHSSRHQEARSSARFAVESILEYQEPGTEDTTDLGQRPERNGAEHLDILRSCLTGASQVVREAAAKQMGRMDDPGVYECLCRAVADPNSSLREAALTALAFAVNGQVREWAIAEYPQVRWHKAVLTVKKARVAPEERIAALEALAQMGPDQSDENREDACAAIDMVVRDDDIPLVDTELFLMIAALRQLGRKAFSPLLFLMVLEDLYGGHPHDSTPYAELRALARAAILGLGRETLLTCEFHEQLLKSPCFQLAVLEILGEFDDGRLAEALELADFAEDEEPAVRQAASEALEKIAARAHKNDAS